MTVEEQPQIETTDHNAVSGEQPKRSLHTLTFVPLILVALVLGYLIYSGIKARAEASTNLEAETQRSAIPSVSVTYPKENAPTEEVVLPGNTQAFTDTPIYARTSGYLQRWYVDIGARVKAGQLLADIETPEVDQQLQQAKADLQSAQANLGLAKSTAERWQFLAKTDSVSKQETDEKVGDLNEKKAAVESAQSNVRRLEETQRFQKIYAPFDGVITARNTDTGSLINAGSSASGKELFHLAAVNRLRVYVNVPEVYARAARPGAKALLTLDEFPGRTFRGTLARTSNSIDMAAHTLLAELDVNNPTGELLPGAYELVHLKLPGQIRAFTVPANTLLFRQEGLRVAVVHDGHAQLVPIKIGRDYGTEVEVVSGLKPKDAIIVNPADSLVSGAAVRANGGESGAVAE
jgi:RND family efflux transporter MFP subunit